MNDEVVTLERTVETGWTGLVWIGTSWVVFGTTVVRGLMDVVGVAVLVGVEVEATNFKQYAAKNSFDDDYDDDDDNNDDDDAYLLLYSYDNYTS